MGRTSRNIRASGPADRPTSLTIRRVVRGGGDVGTKVEPRRPCVRAAQAIRDLQRLRHSSDRATAVGARGQAERSPRVLRLIRKEGNAACAAGLVGGGRKAATTWRSPRQKTNAGNPGKKIGPRTRVRHFKRRGEGLRACLHPIASLVRTTTRGGPPFFACRPHLAAKVG